MYFYFNYDIYYFKGFSEKTKMLKISNIYLKKFDVLSSNLRLRMVPKNPKPNNYEQRVFHRKTLVQYILVAFNYITLYCK